MDENYDFAVKSTIRANVQVDVRDQCLLVVLVDTSDEVAVVLVMGADELVEEDLGWVEVELSVVTQALVALKHQEGLLSRLTTAFKTLSYYFPQ